MDYINSRAVNLIEKQLPLNNTSSPRNSPHPHQQPSPISPYEYHHTTTTLPISNAHNNFMYSNWIGLHAKSPSQTNYLLGLQGKY